jgi:hypothetical protein
MKTYMFSYASRVTVAECLVGWKKFATKVLDEWNRLFVPSTIFVQVLLFRG